MNRIAEIKNQLQQLENQTKELQQELEFEEQKMKIEFPFNLKEEYYCLENDGIISKKWWSSNIFDKKRFRQGNIFKTEEEAEKERDRRILLTRLRQFRDECNGDWKLGCDCGGTYNLFWGATTCELYVHDGSWCHGFSLFGYFKNKADAKRAIELFGDQIKRLFVEE